MTFDLVALHGGPVPPASEILAGFETVATTKGTDQVNLLLRCTAPDRVKNDEKYFHLNNVGWHHLWDIAQALSPIAAGTGGAWRSNSGHCLNAAVTDLIAQQMQQSRQTLQRSGHWHDFIGRFLPDSSLQTRREFEQLMDHLVSWLQQSQGAVAY